MRRFARFFVLMLAAPALLSLAACSAAGSLPTAPGDAQSPAGPSLTETVTPSGG